jgi:hypothetical protein
MLPSLLPEDAFRQEFARFRSLVVSAGAEGLLPGVNPWSNVSMLDASDAV